MYESDSLDLLLNGSIVFLLVIVLITIVFIIFYFVCLWKLFKKAGKNGWEAIIPYYNNWVLVEIAGLNWWYFLITMAGSVISFIGFENLSWITTIVGWIVNFFVFYNLAKKMHKKPIGIAIGGALVPTIMVIVLGLSKKYQYDSSVTVSPNGPIGNNKEFSNNNTATPEKFCLGCGQKIKNNIAFCENCGKRVE